MIPLRDMRHMDFKNPFVKKFTKFREKTNFFPKNLLRENFRGIYLFFFREIFFVKTFAQIFSRKIFSLRYDEKNFTKIIFPRFWRKNLRKSFNEKHFAKKKTKKFPRKYLHKKANNFLRKILRKNFAQNFSAIKFATIFFAIINSYKKILFKNSKKYCFIAEITESTKKLFL